MGGDLAPRRAPVGALARSDGGAGVGGRAAVRRPRCARAQLGGVVSAAGGVEPKARQKRAVRGGPGKAGGVLCAGDGGGPPRIAPVGRAELLRRYRSRRGQDAWKAVPPDNGRRCPDVRAETRATPRQAERA